MKTQHTPGPWKINKKYSFSVETLSDGQGINIIAECSDPDGIRSAGEDSANAKLIAAAPDLLAALEAIIKMIGPYAGQGRMDTEISAARAAIAKARGEA